MTQKQLSKAILNRINELQLRIACKKVCVRFRLRTNLIKRSRLEEMSFRFLPDEPVSAVRMPTGQSILIDPSARNGSSCIEVIEGIARVYCPCEETEGMTLAFLQSGDQLRTDRLCSEGVCVEALTPLCFRSDAETTDEAGGYDAVNEWTLQLLRIRHLGNAEQRLQALFALLVNRLGRRCGDWCQLPFRLTHERIGELIGSTRVTSTRLISRLRSAKLLIVPTGEPILRLNATLIETAPLAS
mgnify:CR=1 FL=1